MTELPASTGAAQSPADGLPVTPEDRLRANTYSVLGRLLAASPDQATIELLAAGPAANEDSLLCVAWQMLAKATERTAPDRITEEYEALFIGIGRGELVPYASWYLTGFLMEQPLARLRTDLKALGFERQDGVCEPEDHAAALCEVMALLGSDEDPCPLAVQADFFDAHIGPWMARFFRDMQQASSARFYRAVGQLGEQFIETEQRYLEMVDRPQAAAAPAVPRTS